MMKSARDIFFEYPYLPHNGPMPMYVEVGEYEALLRLLRQWQTISLTAKFYLPDAYKDLISQLVNDTDTLLGTKQGTLGQPD